MFRTDEYVNFQGLSSVPNLHLWSVWFVLLAVGSLVVFVLREYILKVHILVSSEHKLCQIWNTCIVSCIYWSIAFFKQIVDIFLTKSSILIIEYSSVVAIAEWLDGSFESQSRLEKPNSGSTPESPKICLTRL
jgi:hypothetical protein